ncbi:STAS domain-containing protein [Irregularibacter muris]|jgi:anti-sigma B factor antagonist|uniref:Anti-sigma factor antagonist n=1 Tax=Irregularibacter muris TaxID=1796619 RepID=A0AAE3L0I5_9FIRM|nr:STAS domain-containing protein [Irregularibacter muris]MCR1899987.1 STAS domain-containing protein [Irregularibacter muris]
MILQIQDQYDEQQKKWLVQLEGEIDVYTVNNLKDKINQLLDQHMADILMDCTTLKYIDSTGLGSLIGIRGRMIENNKVLVLTNVQPNVRKLLKITGLDKIFIVEE